MSTDIPSFFATKFIPSVAPLVNIISSLCFAFINFFTSFWNKSEKPLKEKKWVHPELKEEVLKKVVDQTVSIEPKKIRNQELPENEETS